MVAGIALMGFCSLFYTNTSANLVQYPAIKMAVLCSWTFPPMQSYIVDFKFRAQLSDYKEKYKNKNLVVFKVFQSRGSVRVKLKEHKAFLNAASYWHTGVQERKEK